MLDRTAPPPGMIEKIQFGKVFHVWPPMQTEHIRAYWKQRPTILIDYTDERDDPYEDNWVTDTPSIRDQI